MSSHRPINFRDDPQPKTYEEALDYLESHAEPEEIKHVRECDDWVAECHFWFGRHMRNGWNLWAANSELPTTLHEHMKTRFNLSNHAIGDDISGLILHGFEARVKGKEYNPYKEAAHYRQYYEKYGSSHDDSADALAYAARINPKRTEGWPCSVQIAVVLVIFAALLFFFGDKVGLAL